MSAADGRRVRVRHSDDAGATWPIGRADDDIGGHVNVNETTAAELPDGRVHFSSCNDAPGPTPTRPTADGPW
ncbi:hypothetical protein [Streptomyces luteogriseus]|uniref:hypothetical protein n=1 Tax=Streptomyces luteogriseus TaxID=68233 RepID=UPI0036801A4A